MACHGGRVAVSGAGGPPASLVEDLVARVPLVEDVRWVPSTGSTNDDLVAAGAPAGHVLVADEQTAGRGRRGRTWVAPPGTSLLLSVALRPALPARSLALVPLVAGLAVLEGCRAALADAGAGDAGGVSGRSPELALKWPNDLLVDGVKGAGVLVEASGEAVVVGIGVDVDWRGVERPGGLVATSLAEAAGCDVDRWLLLTALLAALDDEVRAAALDPSAVVGRYAGECATLGRQVVAHGRAPVEGTAVGLTPDGHLRVRRADGGEDVVAAGDVEHLR
jgi:BirA family transcriptional regulator, biotin operon repressor / biotin---[acetyl-CoA-carboxylase] ligase